MAMAPDNLEARRREYEAQMQARAEQPVVTVCMGTCGTASGAPEVYEALQREIEASKANVSLVRTGCMGMCEKDLLIGVQRSGGPRYIYGSVNEEKVPRIFAEHVLGGNPIDDWIVEIIGGEGSKSTFYGKQNRRVLRNCGLIDAENIQEYLARDGYAALEKVIFRKSREEIIEEVKRSGLRGRGGAGFPTGLKWEFTYKAQGDKKYIVCNADEGDPGAFMDRSVLEGDPHSVIEGMTICAYAVGADTGYVYVRAEYPLAIRRLRIAIQQAKEHGLLGRNILGSGFNFDLKIKEGAGAFVCGEETALLASIEGKRGMPRPRPPFPAQKGLWGKPTNINNVETYANIPMIIRNGADWYASMGTEKSKGTKVFALTGKVENTGLVEVPMGITLREIVFEIGGGVKDGKEFKAVQIGGPSGGCIPKELIDTPVDYESLIQAGAMMGSGGLVVMDEETCMVDLAKFFLQFTESESCGKCTPCREGTKRMREILTNITEGRGTLEDLDALRNLAEVVKDTALCGLGQTAPNPVLSTLRYFEDEYRAHIVDRRCPAGVCKELLVYEVIPELCKGCLKCKKVCPSGAIEGELKQAHKIDVNICTKCGTCFSACPFGAIVKR